MRKKYNNRSCKCISGHIHDSRGEAEYCTSLEMLKRAGEIKDYKTQVKYSLDVGGKHIANHYVDFVVTLNDGTERIEEYKGFATATWNIKRKLTEALYPDIEYLVIKHR